MTKRLANLALVYAVAALGLGVFFREFTKLWGYTGRTNLSLLHTHYFLLGMFFFLILMLLEKSFGLSAWSRLEKVLAVYQAGLNLTGVGLFVRGLTQVLAAPLSRGLDASISGLSGVGHILLGVSLVLILLQIKKRAA